MHVVDKQKLQANSCYSFSTAELSSFSGEYIKVRSGLKPQSTGVLQSNLVVKDNVSGWTACTKLQKPKTEYKK